MIFLAPAWEAVCWVVVPVFRALLSISRKSQEKSYWAQLNNLPVRIIYACVFVFLDGERCEAPLTLASA